LFFGNKFEGACRSARECTYAWSTSGLGMLFCLEKPDVQKYCFLEKPRWRKLGLNLGSHVWAAWRGAGERALKPQGDYVRWIMVDPMKMAYEPLILIVLVCWVHKLGPIKETHIYGGINLGGHMIVCIVPL
jgi:hypothetical protein